MKLGLKNKSVFISGSTSGIGFACAELFLAEGADVIINGRSKTSVEIAVERLKTSKSNGEVSGLTCDFTKQDEVNAMILKLGKIDVLINNVGIYTSTSFENTKDEDWNNMLEVNVMSGVRLSKAILPEMLKRNSGRIIFVSSECAELVPPDLIAYSTTKAALHAVSRGLAQLCSYSRVTVNTVMPGSTLTEGAEQFLANEAEKSGSTVQDVEANFFKNIRTSSLAGRFLNPKEIAQGILYLASDLSSATNGAVLKLDGGSVGGIL
jgi:NAD(P)-dependent dehydrogenase (short-subunit alcohol dehydrogenase family)